MPRPSVRFRGFSCATPRCTAPSTAEPLPRRLAPGVLALVLAVGFGTVAAAGPAQAQPGPGVASPAAAAGVAWRPGGSDAEVDAALAEARQRGVPVLLYWGARWCPPCNRLKATLFPRADFVAMTESLVPVHVDGDAPGAQRIGARFQVRAYPTLVLLSPQGREITRLPGEADTAQVLRVVQAGLAGGRPVSALVADARAGRPLDRNAWRMLAFFSWATAAESELRAADRPAVLADLALAAAASARAPGGDGADDDTAARLLLQALAAANAQQGLVADDGVRERVRRLLADRASVRRHADLLIGGADALARGLAPEPGAARRTWAGRLDAALVPLQDDASLARSDRLDALAMRVELARLDDGRAVQPAGLQPTLERAVVEAAGRVDREIRDTHERQAVIPTAAHALARVGRWDEASALLQANLTRVGEPYALMSQLASQSKQRGRADDALRWSGEAYQRSRGPATRLQWGAGYLALLTELAPDDAVRIEAVAGQLLREAAADGGAFHERSGRSLQRIGRVLGTWAAASAGSPAVGARRAALDRLSPARDALCAAQPAGGPERATCERLWTVPAAGG
jgi:thiol-disulfide isomerase/thioredoxin